jgi:hypothetical protein
MHGSNDLSESNIIMKYTVVVGQKRVEEAANQPAATVQARI